MCFFILININNNNNELNNNNTEVILFSFNKMFSIFKSLYNYFITGVLLK